MRIDTRLRERALDPDDPRARRQQRNAAIQQLREAAAALGIAAAALHAAGLPASARAAQRQRDRVTALRHTIEDGDAHSPVK